MQMYVIDNMVKGYQTASKDLKCIENFLHKEMKTAGYYKKKELEEKELFIGLSFPIQLLYRCMGKDYWGVEKHKEMKQVKN